jgi:hypothetical protein
MAEFDVTGYKIGVLAGNSSQQIAETMALHQTIKGQVEETVELHKTIREQINVTNQQGRLIWWLSIAVAVLTLVQAIGTVIQVWPVVKKPDQEKHSKPTLQEGEEQGNALPAEVIQVLAPKKPLTLNPAVEGTLCDKAASRPSP